MSRDYRRRTESRSRRTTPGWALFALGFLFGAFAVGYAWVRYGPEELRQLLPSKSAAVAKTESKDAEKEKEREKERPSGPRPTFSFYTVLPEMEVVVSDEEVNRRAKQPPAAAVPHPPPAAAPSQAQTQAPAQAPAAPAPPQSESLLLQVAAFKKPEEADRMKAKLALLGVTADIQSVSINNEAAFYRVRIGPFNNAAKLKDVRDKLKGNGYDSVVVRLK
ncbi:MAG: SPOR domain-containing protein [Gammaproteobacteria bacterium]|jgi:cell division protein FtsN|nr:SPOR domain-containing protein [Gammaproteobacteria bacterium]